MEQRPFAYGTSDKPPSLKQLFKDLNQKGQEYDIDDIVSKNALRNVLVQIGSKEMQATAVYMFRLRPVMKMVCKNSYGPTMRYAAYGNDQPRSHRKAKRKSTKHPSTNKSTTRIQEGGTVRGKCAVLDSPQSRIVTDRDLVVFPMKRSQKLCRKATL